MAYGKCDLWIKKKFTVPYLNLKLQSIAKKKYLSMKNIW